MLCRRKTEQLGKNQAIGSLTLLQFCAACLYLLPYLQISLMPNREGWQTHAASFAGSFDPLLLFTDNFESASPQPGRRPVLLDARLLRVKSG